MVADSRTDLGWLRWTSPLGWVENLAPLTTPRPVAFLPIVLLVAATAGAAVVLSGRRDVGDGAWARADRVRRAHRPIRGPVALTARLERGVAAAWIGGLALLAAVFGAAARAAAGGGLGNKSIGQVVGRAGTGAPAATWLGYELLYVSAILAFAAAAQISATRADEADGLVDNLLVRPLTRRRWLLTRIGLAAVAVFVAGVASGVGGWLGVGGGKGLGLGRMLQAGVSIAVPGLVVLGLGTLVYGLLPRLAAPVLYAFVLWSFVVSVIGATITTSRWLLDTSLLTHLGAVPATEPRWGVVLTMLGICVVAASLGVVAFERRDLAGD
jgi:ABC-2 type transport system permease protein